MRSMRQNNERKKKKFSTYTHTHTHEPLLMFQTDSEFARIIQLHYLDSSDKFFLHEFDYYCYYNYF